MVTQFTSEYAVAFLDLLGFKHFVKEDLRASLEMLHDIQQVVATAIDDAEHYPPESYDAAEMARVAEDNQISSFDVFLPISDSVIVLSGNPSLMVRQLSNFVVNCFNFTSSVYGTAKDGKDPSMVVIPTVRPTKDGKLDVDEWPTHWYPKLFRGGISFGAVTRISSSIYVGNQRRDFINIAGMAYVNATLLEKTKLKGPRLFCDLQLYESLDESTKPFVVPTEISDVYEVLWPAFQFSANGDPDIERHQFPALYAPIKALSKFNADKNAAEHYHQFEVLWARSTIKYFTTLGKEQMGMSLVKDHFGDRVIQESSKM